MKRIVLTTIFILFMQQTVFAGRAVIKKIAEEPYASALVINADTGKTLFADHADKKVYPASVLKLMDLLIILEQADAGALQLDDMVQITEEAYKMGGSQVYLDPSEQFSINDLLYALMIQSANDAAVALATHVAGSKEAFVELMNQKAAQLGMNNTRFYSVHGLPPSTGQKVDVTTAHDFAILCRELAQRSDVYTYTASKVRDFRDGKFIMRTHNHLLDKLSGCDGFKTGFFDAAGFSIAATAQRNGIRLIALVMGSKSAKVRDAKAIQLINKGFVKAASQPVPNHPTRSVVEPPQLQPESAVSQTREPEHTSLAVETTKVLAQPKEKSCFKSFFLGVVTGGGLFAALTFFVRKKRSKRNIRRPRL
ncbi:D-alanyl-D-alanine carboxypeptidase family protein [Desulfovulcanus sp.]